MENIYKGIKNFILANASAFTSLSEEGLTVDAPKESDFVFGVADLLKKKNKLVVAIKPENGDEAENDFIDDELISTEWTVAFICRQNTQDKLDRLICKYLEAFRNIVVADCNLNGTCESSEIGQRVFYMNAGGLDMQMSAVEITFTTITSIH